MHVLFNFLHIDRSTSCPISYLISYVLIVWSLLDYVGGCVYLGHFFFKIVFYGFLTNLEWAVVLL